jgi:outer membrane translocation and assembly module TamA
LAGSFLQGSNTFARSIFVAKYFHPVGRQSVIGGAFEVGWMDSFGGEEEIPLNERFYSGGPTSLRGFGYQMVGPVDHDGDPLGGKFKIVWNVVELRRALYKVFGGAVFLDVGNVWQDINGFKPRTMRVDAGAGLRLNSPIGIVRVDYGANLDRRANEPRGKIFLGMGQAF